MTTHWASIAGKAKIITDVEKIKPMYSADVRAVRPLLLHLLIELMSRTRGYSGWEI